MTGPVTIYVPLPAAGAARAASGAAEVRPVDQVRPAADHRPPQRGADEVAELARKAREAAAAARAFERHVGAEERDRPLMAAFARPPDSVPGRAAADTAYRTVEEFGPSRWGRGYLFDVEV